MSYKFKVGDKGKTRAGKNYRVVCVDRKSEIFPVVALISGRRPVDAEQLVLTRSTGRYYEFDGRNLGTDLMPPSVTKYLNVWIVAASKQLLCSTYENQKLALAIVNSTTNDQWLIKAQPVEVQES